ncbi:hypothetical protein B0J17DRAFT_678711 [Rhizoctonia solani]|nr:hypothetical protein B0J17DRAFT_678711 [Rhizoctonia solani]
MSEQCVSCELELNNDIMGIGVRAALYAQIILAWLMSLKYPDTFVKNSRSAYMTATALLVASLIEWKTQSLSLLDALVVSLMSSMMTIFIVVSGTSREKADPTPDQPPQTTSTSTNPSTTPPEAGTPPDSTRPSSTPPPATQQNTSQYPTTSTSTQPTGSPAAIPQVAHITLPSVQQQTIEQQATAQASDPVEPGYKPRRSNTQWFIRFCFVNIWGGWCFNLWNDPAHFGLEGLKANCTTNNDITIWVFGVEVHAITPWLRIAALVLISVLYFIATCSLFFTLEDILEPVLRMFRFLGGLFTITSPKGGNDAPGLPTQRSLHEDPAINSVHYLLHFFAFGTLLYLIISTEMTVRNNDKEREMMEWSYGQVIALILLLQQFMDVCSTFIEGREESQMREERAKWEAQVDTERQEDISMNNLSPTTPDSILSKK